MIITNVVPGCARVLKADNSNFTFDDQVAGFLNVLSMPNSTTQKSHYFGLAADVASCKDKIAVELYLKNGYLSKYNFAQLFPIGPTCAYVTTEIRKRDRATIGILWLMIALSSLFQLVAKGKIMTPMLHDLLSLVMQFRKVLFQQL